MIPNDLLARLANALQIDPTRLLTAEPSSPNLEIPWAAGDKVSAVVEANLIGGRTLARVGELPLDLKLPFPVKPGDRLALTLVSRQPSIVFALADPSRPAEPVQVSSLGQRIGALVKQLDRETLLQRQPAKAEAASIAKPLLAQPTLDTGKLAQALKQGVSESGLFYESHQAQWVLGERPREALFREPQGKLPPIRAHNDTLPGRPASIDSSPDRKISASSRAVSETVPAKIIGEMIRPETATQVQQQMHTLDSRQVVWQGQPWPGVPMEWRIDDPPQREAGSSAEITWNTSLNLSLPHLGGVRARLNMTGNQIRLQLNVDAEPARGRLTQRVTDLSQSLTDAGLVLDQLVIDVNGPA